MESLVRDILEDLDILKEEVTDINYHPPIWRVRIYRSFLNSNFNCVVISETEFSFFESLLFISNALHLSSLQLHVL